MTKGRRLPVLSRRDFVVALSALPGLGVLACSKAKGGSLTCTDVAGLNEAERKRRVALAYVDKAPDPERECDRCAQYLGVPDGCGSCKLLRGPINPGGSCKEFAEM